MKTATEYLANGFPVASCTVTFLPSSEGGRMAMPHLSNTYRPHVVVQAPTVRHATIGADGMGNEKYLGVQFFGGIDDGEFGSPYKCSLVFTHHSRVDYSIAIPGSTFTVREGSRVVGFGKIETVTLPRPDLRHDNA